MNLPASFELLDSVKYFESYYKGGVNLTSHLNYYFKPTRKGRLGDQIHKVVADLLGYVYQKNDGVKINKYADQKSLKNAKFMSTIILCEGSKEMLDELFGNGKTTNRLGEGRATAYFVKINGKLVLLFHDTRGVSIEVEEGLSDDEFLFIETELIKYLYSGYTQEWKDEMNKIMGR